MGCSLNVDTARLLDLQDFIFAQHACDPCRTADDERAVFKGLSFRDQSAGTHEAILADARAVEHDRLNADQGAIINRAPMKHGLMADGDVCADAEWQSRVRVQDGGFLDIRACANGDGGVVGANDCLWPDTGVRSDARIANDDGRICDPGATVDTWNELVELIDGHDDEVWSMR